MGGNVEKMRGSSVAVDNYEIGKEILNYCKSLIKLYTGLLIYGIISVLVFSYIIISSFSNAFYIRIAFILVILSVGFGAFYAMSKIRVLKNEFNNIQNNGATLLCYSSDIVEYYTTREADNKGRNYYLRLNDGVELRINSSKFKDFQKRNIKSVNVYYYEKLFELDSHMCEIEDVEY